MFDILKKFVPSMNKIGTLYIVLFLYKNVLWYYPLIMIYHIRWWMEWISFFIPISVQFFVFSAIIILVVVQKLKKYIS